MMANITARFCRSRKYIFIFLIIILGINLLLPFGQAHAQTPTINPANSQWVVDPVVTEVGKNAERARQLLYWVFSHQGIHTAPILAQIWAISRNIVYVFIVFILVAFGIGLMISRRKGTLGPMFSGVGPAVFGFTVPSIFFRLAAILLYVTFSYLAVLALIQTSDIVMRFFIENVGGKDLFNVIFSGSGDTERNYSSFLGYRDISIGAVEMANTSIFLIRFSSMTYYVISILLILRTIILWFLMILSPFLALLIPFMFIKNTGLIWIGVFFQWLFYGPLVALFLSVVTKIWVSGIPYSFDFSRANKPAGQVYRTAINILYGGPAQVVTAGNSANYIDTYAEYVISLVMLWAAIILPWFLLRIFRDYCCDAIATGNATMTGILDRVRQYPTPIPSVPSVPSAAGVAVELPFRRKVEERVKEVTKTYTENVRNITNESSRDLTKSLDLAVSSLRDLTRLEQNQTQNVKAHETLRKISSPENITSHSEREKFSSLRNELQKRSAGGDLIARSILTAASNNKSEIASHLTSGTFIRSGISAVPVQKGTFAPAIPLVLPTSTSTIASFHQSENLARLIEQTNLSEQKAKQILNILPTVGNIDDDVINNIVQTVNISEDNIEDVLTTFSLASIPTSNFVKNVAQKTGVAENNIAEIISTTSLLTSSTPRLVDKISQMTSLAQEKTVEVLNAIPTVGVTTANFLQTVAQKTAVPENKILQILSASTGNYLTDKRYVERVAGSLGVSEEKVQEVIKTITLASTAPENIISTISRETNVTESKVAEILNSSFANAASNPLILQRVSQEVNRPTEKIKQILEMVPAAGIQTKEFVSTLSEKSNISSDKILEILSETSTVILTQPQFIKDLTQKLGVSEEKIRKVVDLVGLRSVKPIVSDVSLEDYEEVKKMWLKHYKDAPIPESETIGTREDWLDSEEKKLSMMVDLLSGSDPHKKQKGLEQVAEILPFMLLGGLSDKEILTYIKAKYEAVRQVQSETEALKKAGEEVRKEISDNAEENLISVPQKSQAKNEGTLKASQDLELPVEEDR